MKISRMMKRYHKDEAYDATTARDMLASLMSVLSMIKYALAGIGAISSLLGGRNWHCQCHDAYGEREDTEIGVMKALGATTRDIRMQYLLEAGVLGLVSSIIGIAMVTVSYLIGSLASLPSAITTQSILLGLLFGVVTTTIAGVYPPTVRLSLIPSRRCGRSEGAYPASACIIF